MRYIFIVILLISAVTTKADVEIPSIIKFSLGNKTYFTQGYFFSDNVDEIIINEALNDYIWDEIRSRHYAPYFKNISQIDLSKFEINYPIKYYLFLDKVNIQIDDYKRSDFKILKIIKKGNSPYMSILTELSIQDLKWLNEKTFNFVKTVGYEDSCVIIFSTSLKEKSEIELFIKSIEACQKYDEMIKKIQELKLKETITFIFCDY